MKPGVVAAVVGLAAVSVASGCASDRVTETGSASSFASSKPAFSLSETAAGPITADTLYSPSALQQMFPSFRFDTVQTMADGQVMNLLTGFDSEGFQAFQVEAAPDRQHIASIQVVGPAASGPRGERIGMTFEEAGGRRMTCEAGSGPWTGFAICGRSDSRIRYVFAPELYLGPSGQLPPPDELRSARLVRMIWKA